MSGMSRSAVELYVLRHAHAGDPMRWTGPDERRPLSQKGHRQADAVARHLAALHVAVNAIVSSPKLRAIETAEAVASALGRPIIIDDRLGGGLEVAALEAMLADLGDPQRVIIVGHDPDFSGLVADLAGAASIPMRKGALARLDAARPLSSGSAILRWLLPPDALEATDRTDDGAG
jgi:phosphohistidine phosphatase